MDPALKTLKVALEAIRDLVTNALNQIELSQGDRSMRWKCKACQYIKHFTKAVPLETTGRCPRCKSAEFRPIL
jgi:predicted Zn-ribbon and HTH transcriptional regulator